MKNQKKHIVIDARIRPSSTGRYIDRVLEHLQTIDTHNKYTVLLSKGDEWKPKAKNFSAQTCRFRSFSFNPIDQLLFSRQLYKLKADLVHFAMTGYQPLFYFGNQVTTTNDLTMFKFTRRGRLPMWAHRLRMWGYHLLIWQAHKKAKYILTFSEYTRDAVAKFHTFTSRKIVITPLATEPPLTEKSMPVEEVEGRYIMYTGSSFPHKNLKRLVKAFARVSEGDPSLHLVLVGKKEYHSNQLQKWVKEKGITNVIFTGFVSDGELKWLYENTLAYVFPSLSEGFGLPSLEAMAHGAPVASSNASCLPEVNGEAAQYFDPLDIESMAQVIKRVVGSSSLRQKLVTAGYRQVKKYSWKRTAQQTLEAYKKVLEK